MQRIPSVVLTLLALWAGACGAGIKSIAGRASEAAVNQGAEALSNPNTQQDIAAATRDPELQAATVALSKHITEGVLAALASDDARSQIAALTRTASQEILASVAGTQTREQLALLSRAVVEGALDELGQKLQSDLRPVIGEVVREDLTQGIAAALRSQDLRPALNDTVQELAYHAVLGVNNGVGAAWRGDQGALGEARALALGIPNFSSAWLWLAVSIAAPLVLFVVCVVIIVVARARRVRWEMQRLESATLLLATAMRERQQTSQSDEILAVVQQALESRAERTGKHRLLGALKLGRTG